MPVRERLPALLCALALASSPGAFAQEEPELPSTADRPSHQDSAREHADATPPEDEIDTPPLPEGMTLDDVLGYSAGPPPDAFPDPVPDDRAYVFTYFEQLEYRVPDGGSADHAAWDAQGWVGHDYDRFWWKSEGEAVFEGPGEGESEHDLLYSRLVTPFWNVQVGARYANGWTDGSYNDTWSGVIGLQGLAPYKFEIDAALYVSEEADFSLELEAEYDLRITQRLVLQPRAELSLYGQDIPGRDIGAGLSDVVLDARLRYEIRRELAPYLGVRYAFQVGETADRMKAAGKDTGRFLFLLGLRFAF